MRPGSRYIVFCTVYITGSACSTFSELSSRGTTRILELDKGYYWKAWNWTEILFWAKSSSSISLRRTTNISLNLMHIFYFATRPTTLLLIPSVLRCVLQQPAWHRCFLSRVFWDIHVGHFRRLQDTVSAFWPINKTRGKFSKWRPQRAIYGQV